MSRAVVVPACLLVACASAPKEPLVPPPRANDTCSAIPRGCPGGADDEGCPDTLIPMGDDCAISESSRATLEAASQDALNERDLDVLRIVGPSKLCANAVRAYLEASGFASTRIETRIDPGRSFVSFEVAAWKGARCQ